MYPIHIIGIIFTLLHIILKAIRDGRRNKLSTDAGVRGRVKIKREKRQKVYGRSEKNGILTTLLSPWAIARE